MRIPETTEALPPGTRLGRPCLHGHQSHGALGTLRYARSGACVKCSQAAGRAYYLAHRRPPGLRRAGAPRRRPPASAMTPAQTRLWAWVDTQAGTYAEIAQQLGIGKKYLSFMLRGDARVSRAIEARVEVFALTRTLEKTLQHEDASHAQTS